MREQEREGTLPIWVTLFRFLGCVMILARERHLRQRAGESELLLKEFKSNFEVEVATGGRWLLTGGEPTLTLAHPHQEKLRLNHITCRKQQIFSCHCASKSAVIGE